MNEPFKPDDIDAVIHERVRLAITPYPRQLT